MAQWYYSKKGTQLGPVAEDELRAKLASGEISMTDLVWKDGMPDWLQAAKIPGLAPQPAFPSTIPQAPGNSPYSPPSAPGAYGAVIPNYLWQSIVVTILCCWPLGIPAIVYAAKVDGLKARGDIQGAMAASASAKTWCMVAGGIGLGFVILVFIGAFFSAATSR